MDKQTIKDWAVDDRPREKLVNKGAESLSNSELIAILILNGAVNKSAVDLAKEILSKADNSLQKLGKLTVKDLVNLKLKGLGPAKAVSIVAAMELGIRRNMADYKKEIILTSRDLANYLKAQFQFKRHEVFAVVFLNRSNKINHFEIISEGGITGTVADPRIILKRALEHDAISMVLCHNHPSGSLKPSRQDEELTERIKIAAKFFDIRIMDHLIVSDEGFYSFADEGIL